MPTRYSLECALAKAPTKGPDCGGLVVAVHVHVHCGEHALVAVAGAAATRTHRTRECALPPARTLSSQEKEGTAQEPHLD
jgi:hypothetical protein